MKKQALTQSVAFFGVAFFALVAGLSVTSRGNNTQTLISRDPASTPLSIPLAIDLPSSPLGMSESPGRNYQTLAEDVSRAIRQSDLKMAILNDEQQSQMKKAQKALSKTPALLRNRLAESLQYEIREPETTVVSLREEFEQICRDNDGRDSVQWEYTNDRQAVRLLFECQHAGDPVDENATTVEVSQRNFIFEFASINTEKRTAILDTVAGQWVEPLTESRLQLKLYCEDPNYSYSQGRVALAAVISAHVSYDLAEDTFVGEPDKPKHEGGESMLSAFGASLVNRPKKVVGNTAYFVRQSPSEKALHGALRAFSLGFGKEAIDKSTGGRGSAGDLKADARGVAVGALFYYVQELLFGKCNK